MNAVARTCIRCGAGLSAESALDVYPRCIARQALAATDGPGTDTLPSPALLEQPGDRIGRYKLLQKIGEGGCGVVYVAEQEEPVRRRVALKVIKPGMDTRQVIARFEAERQALALMDHPNIAKVYDGGTTETGRPFFVMELVRGVRITEYCDENNLSTAQRLDLFTQVCHAVQHAHQKGIIHRDLKPSNILVTINDGVHVPKVIDFGIAKATEQRLTDKTLFTEFHQFIGTPAYMSPEQALMTSLDIDTRSDIYSLGVLLYELLTGRTPLDTPELMKVGVDEMRRTIREVEPARPRIA
jgi:serine/threonine protein kinase